MALYAFCGAALYTLFLWSRGVIINLLNYALAERATENGSKIRFKRRISPAPVLAFFFKRCWLPQLLPDSDSSLALRYVQL